MKALTSLLIVLSVPSVFGQVSKRDVKFIEEAAQGNRSEVVLGRLASKRGFSADIRKFGEQMVRDHSRALADLKVIAMRKHIPITTTVNAEDAALYRRLSRLTGRAFDRAYRTAMIEDHEKDTAEFVVASNRASDPEVRAYAKKVLARLWDHLRMIRLTKP